MCENETIVELVCVTLFQRTFPFAIAFVGGNTCEVVFAE
jgi:hypothetical protein